MRQEQRCLTHDRVNSVDALRGIALTGVLLVHVEEFYELNIGPTSGSTILHAIIMSALSGKSFSLLALCFGFSFHVLSTKWASSAKGKSNEFLHLSLSRYAVLAGIGWVHGLLYRGDVLAPLALIGLLLIPLRYVRSSVALAIVAGICLAHPYLLWHLMIGNLSPETPDLTPGVAMHAYLTGSFTDVLRVNLWTGQLDKWRFLLGSGRAFQMLGYSIIGILLGRSGYFAMRLPRNSRDLLLSRITILTIPVLAMLKIYLHFHRGYPSGPLTSLDYLTVCCSDFLQTLAYLTLFTAMWRSRYQSMLTLFSPLGRNSLTFYVLQSIIFVPVFYPFGLGYFNKLSETQAAVIGVAACAAQLALAAIIQSHFRHGPLEWLWRRCTGLIVDAFNQLKRTGSVDRAPAAP